MKTSLMNNLGLKILAFLAAGLLWLMVVNIDDPVTIGHPQYKEKAGQAMKITMIEKMHLVIMLE